MKKLGHENRHITIFELAYMLGISFGSYQNILMQDLYHDSAPAHSSLFVQEFLAKSGTLFSPRSGTLRLFHFSVTQVGTEGKKI
jgi:hypothetical protein